MSNAHLINMTKLLSLGYQVHNNPDKTIAIMNHYLNATPLPEGVGLVIYNATDETVAQAWNGVFHILRLALQLNQAVVLSEQLTSVLHTIKQE